MECDVVSAESTCKLAAGSSQNSLSGSSSLVCLGKRSSRELIKRLSYDHHPSRIYQSPICKAN